MTFDDLVEGVTEIVAGQALGTIVVAGRGSSSGLTSTACARAVLAATPVTTTTAQRGLSSSFIGYTSGIAVRVDQRASPRTGYPSSL